MDARIFGDYMVGKIENKFYVFDMRASLGGVAFSRASEAFHTAEDAHHWLIREAMEKSTPETKLLVVEVQAHYMLIGETEEPDDEIEC